MELVSESSLHLGLSRPQQGYGFSSSHVWMWELDCEESWALKNWCFWTVVLEKTLESPLDRKEIQPVHSKEDQPWVFFGRNDAEAETSVLWPPHAKSWLIGKDCDAGRDWGQEEKGMTEDEMAGWHYWLDGHEFEWTPRVGDGQGGLVCCSSWSRKESDTTEWLNWPEFMKKTEHRRIDAFELWLWEKILARPLDCKEIQPVHPKGDQSWVFIGRTIAEAVTPILCPPHVKNWLIGKDPDYERDWE